MGNKQIVTVRSETGAPGKALAQPRFLIQCDDGRIYLTSAVLEFHGDHAPLTPRQSSDIAELQQMLADEPSCGKVIRFTVDVDRPAQTSVAGDSAPLALMHNTGGAVSFAQTDPPDDR